MADRAAIVIGAGDALGGAIARRFAQEGHAAVLVRRHADQLEPPAHIIIDGAIDAAWTHEVDLRPWMEAW